MSGGVDVFLALTGFLATRSLMSRIERRDLRLVDHYGRTFLRLSAPGLLVLAATAVLMVLVMPEAMWRSTVREIAASATYLLNWEMIHSQLDYGAAGPDTSPLQHFWSLAVQGQFLLVWPLLLLTVWYLARRRARGALTALVAAGTVASFVFAWHLGATDQPVAYFHTGTRFWEIGLGALLALSLTHLRPPDALRPFLAWLGLALVASSGLFLDGGALFPGPWALWPVGGAILVVLASGTTSPLGPQKFLALPPLRFIADISFPLYLWHWPLLIAYLHLTGTERPDWRAAAIIISVSMVLAWLTRALVEQPLRRTDRWLRGFPRFAVVTVLLGAVTMGSFAGIRQIDRQEAELAASADRFLHDYAGCVGAAAMDPEGSSCSVSDPEVLLEMVAGYDADEGRFGDCWSNRERPVRFNVCALGPESGYERRILVTGDSHNNALAVAYEKIAETYDWRIDLASRAGCHWNARAMSTKNPESAELCTQWNQMLDEYIQTNQDYDAYVVLHSARKSVQKVGDESRIEALSRGLSEAWATRPDLSVPVIAIRDNPTFTYSASDFESTTVPCIAENGLAAGVACAKDRDEALRRDGSAEAVALDPNAHLIDLTDYYCGPETCSPVVGYVPVYQDGYHVTKQFAETLAPYLGRQLHDAVEGVASPTNARPTAKPAPHGTLSPSDVTTDQKSAPAE